MKQRTRIYYSEADKVEMWNRWQAGESMHDIARLFDRHHPSIRRILTENGGIRLGHTSLKGKALGKIVDAVTISERPASVEDRAVPGHWEGDLIAGTNGSHIATLVERHTRYVMLARVDNKDTATVIRALIKQSHKLPSELYKSLTWDRGSEMANHKKFTLATDIKVYFCDPRSPW